MRSKLEKLLAAYEAERASLTTEMEECVTELDYGRAHLFFKSLGRVNQQLQTLYNLQDKWHDERECLTHWVKCLEEQLTVTEGYSHHYIAERLAADKEKLAALREASAQKAIAGHTVREVLNKLLAGEVTGFTLVFQESKRLSCHGRLVRKTLILTLPEVRRHRVDYTFQKRHIKYLERLGFRLYDNKDKLMLFAPYSAVEDINAVQRLLARITFDIFYFKELAGETFIKYHS